MFDGGKSSTGQTEMTAPVDAGGSSFVANVMALLARTEYRRCESGEDIEAINRLRYRAYRAFGFIPQSSSGSYRDELDDVPNCYRFGVYIDEELACTVRIHHLSASHPASPAMKVFGDALAPRLERGESFVNPTLLAAEPALMAKHRALPYITLRLGLLASIFFDATACIGVVREEHTGFYRRVFGAVQVGEPRTYPPFTVPVMLYDANCAINREPILRRHPFFHSTAAERRLLFARPKSPDLGPLTVLPSVRYVKAA